MLDQAASNDDVSGKHSYFLRTKMPRLYDDLEEGEFRKSPLLPSPTPLSPISKSDGEEEDLANCLVMLSSNKSHKVTEKGGGSSTVFQCKACKKVFNSHQALGGHRASHKKVKGCFASKMDDEDSILSSDQELIISTPLDHPDNVKTPKMHECSVCRRVFSSGQALGGHKRCHWLTTSSDNAFISPNFQYDQQICKKQMVFTTTNNQHSDEQEYPYKLDLNLHLPIDHAQQWGSNEGSQNQEKRDKAECEVKLQKLSDVNLDGRWLQMGISSSTTDIF